MNVVHLNGDLSDNTPENLAWSASKHGLVPLPKCGIRVGNKNHSHKNNTVLTRAHMRDISKDLMDRLLSTENQNQLSKGSSKADGVQYVRLPVCDVTSEVSLYTQSLTPAETDEFKKIFNLAEVDDALKVFGTKTCL